MCRGCGGCLVVGYWQRCAAAPDTWHVLRCMHCIMAHMVGCTTHAGLALKAWQLGPSAPCLKHCCLSCCGVPVQVLSCPFVPLHTPTTGL